MYGNKISTSSHINCRPIEPNADLISNDVLGVFLDLYDTLYKQCF